MKKKITKKITKKIAKRPLPQLQLATRNQFDDLRNAVGVMSQVVDQSDRSSHYALENIRKQDHRIDKLQVDVKKMLELLGLEPRCYAHAGEHVAWSYFHVWVRRINNQLQELEMSITKLQADISMLDQRFQRLERIIK
jgi:hypothetical protein